MLGGARRLAAWVLPLAALVSGVTCGLPPEPAEWRPTAPSVLAAAEDALHRRTVAELRVFTDWLDANDARGYVGEVGWPGETDPDADRWALLAERWFAEADAAGLRVDVWATGEWWGLDYDYAPFVASDGDGPVDTRRSAGTLLAWQARHGPQPRGVSVAGAEFGSPGGAVAESAFSQATPGQVGLDYHYDSAETFAYLAAEGVDSVRLPFRWERVQPELGGPLAPAEVDRLRAAVARAHAAGLEVVLDMHNYGAYFVARDGRGARRPIGSPEVTVQQFSDVWRRLSETFRDVAGVAGYGLMNEPVGLPARPGGTAAETWEAASQAAVLAVRGTGDRTPVMVAGYDWSHTRSWVEHHPDAWVDDPAGAVLYEAHHYWQREHGTPYDRELAAAEAAGW